MRWSSGAIEVLKNIKANQLIYVKEGEGMVKAEELMPIRTPPASKSG